MLREILLEEEVDFFTFKHSNALKKFGTLYNVEKQKKKFKLLCPLKASGFSLIEAKKLNFETNKRIWKSCDNGLMRNNGGRPKIGERIINKVPPEIINKYMMGISSCAANRFLLKLKTNARYREGTYKNAFINSPFKNKISFSSYKNNICKRFKNPHRISDLCDICESGIVII